MSSYIEPVEELEGSVRDNVRALTTVKEEVEAVIWYQQRAAACADQQLRKVVEHTTCLRKSNTPVWLLSG